MTGQFKSQLVGRASSPSIGLTSSTAKWPEDSPEVPTSGTPEITVGVQVDQPDVTREAGLQITSAPSGPAHDESAFGRTKDLAT